MAFLSDELENLYQEWKNGGSEISKKFYTFIVNKLKEGNIVTTKDLVEYAIYLNGIVNKSSFVKNSIFPHNVVIRRLLDSLPEEMATAYYDYNHNLKEKLEELEKKRYENKENPIQYRESQSWC